MQIRGLQLGGQDGQQLQQGRSFRKDQFAEILGTRHHQRSGLHEVLLRRLSLEEFGNNLPDTSLPNEELYQLLSTIQAPAASLESPSNFHPLRRVMFTALRSQALRARVVAALVQLQKLAGEAQLEAGRVQLSCSTVSFQIARSHGTTWFHLMEPTLEVQASRENMGFAKELTAMLQSDAEPPSNIPNIQAFLPLKAFCAARAAARLMAGPDVEADLASSTVRPTNGLKLQQLTAAHPEAWLSRLAATHENLLHALGFQNLDPGSCWDGKMFTFSVCCSVGEYVDNCWHGGYSDERCCHPLRAPELGSQDTSCPRNRHLLDFTQFCILVHCHCFYVEMDPQAGLN